MTKRATCGLVTGMAVLRQKEDAECGEGASEGIFWQFNKRIWQKTQTQKQSPDLFRAQARQWSNDVVCTQPRFQIHGFG